MQRNRNAYSIDEASKAIKEAEKQEKQEKKVDKQYEDDVTIKNNVNLSKSEKR